MTWVRQARSKEHRCPTPVRAAELRLPTGPANASTGLAVVRVPGLPRVVGRLGDLWRCGDCHKLWRVGRACGYCDAYGTQPHGGQHAVGLRWRHATLWQRIAHRRSRTKE